MKWPRAGWPWVGRLGQDGLGMDCLVHKVGRFGHNVFGAIATGGMAWAGRPGQDGLKQDSIQDGRVRNGVGHGCHGWDGLQQDNLGWDSLGQDSWGVMALGRMASGRTSWA